MLKTPHYHFYVVDQDHKIILRYEASFVPRVGDTLEIGGHFEVANVVVHTASSSGGAVQHSMHVHVIKKTERTFDESQCTEMDLDEFIAHVGNFHKSPARTDVQGKGVEWRWKSGTGDTVQIGFTNRNGQSCCGHRDVSGTDHNQLAYKVECTICGFVYGANGADMHERLCPECQGGAPGIPFWTTETHS